jgi:hypothetical protein
MRVPAPPPADPAAQARIAAFLAGRAGKIK